jgi:hypothetical protein
VSLVQFRPEAPNPSDDSSSDGQQKINYAGVAHLAERHLAKVEVASSNLVARSNISRFAPNIGASDEIKFKLFGAPGPKLLNPKTLRMNTILWRHSQVVRQWTANPRFPQFKSGWRLQSIELKALIFQLLLALSLSLPDYALNKYSCESTT